MYPSFARLPSTDARGSRMIYNVFDGARKLAARELFPANEDRDPALEEKRRVCDGPPDDRERHGLSFSHPAHARLGHQNRGRDAQVQCRRCDLRSVA